MPTVTTQELVDRAKAVSDMRDNFVTPTQWLYWATQERLALDLLLARSGWPLQLSTYTISGSWLPNIDNDGDSTIELTNGVYRIADNQNVMAIVAVHQVRNNSYRRLKMSSAVDFSPTSRSTGDAMTYRVTWTGDVMGLEFWPQIRSGDSYLVTFLLHPLKLVYSGAVAGVSEVSVSYPMGWEERIVLGMARRALIKEESDTRAIDSEIALWESRIEEAAWGRVLSEAPSVRNSDITVYGWTDRYSIPPYSSWLFV